MEKLIWNEKWLLLVDDNNKKLEIIELEDLKYREFSKKVFRLDLVENLAAYDNNYKIIVNEEYDYKWITVEKYLVREKRNFLDNLSFTEKPEKFNRIEWNDNFVLLIDKNTKTIDIVESFDLHLRELNKQDCKIDLVENLCLYKDYSIRETYIVNNNFNQRTVSVKEFLDNEKRDFIDKLDLDKYFV